MATITPIAGTDLISAGPATLNTNFNNLNTDKIETNLTLHTPIGADSLATYDSVGLAWKRSLVSSLPYATLTGVETLTNKTLTSPTLNTPSVSNPSFTTPVNFGSQTTTFAETDNGNSGAADTINWTTSNKQKSTLTANTTFTFVAPAGPASLILKLVQDAGGSRTVTWPANVRWPSGAAPTLTTTANQIDLISFYYDGTNYYGNSSLNFTP